MRGRVVAELLVLALAVPPIAWALHTDVAWFVRHWSVDTRTPWVAQLWRAGTLVVAAALVLVVRPRAGRWVARVGGASALASAGRMALALVVAVAATEIVLRIVGVPKKHDFRGSCDNEMGEPDPRTGWVWKGPYARTVNQGGRPVHFAFDEHHDRVRSPAEAEDPGRPTIVLVGESIVAGHGLEWDESLAGRIGAALGVQVVTLGVDGYGSDQAFVRLFDALPRFSRVQAVVTIFFPGLVDRVGWDDRPRLAFAGDQPVIGPPRTGFWGDTRVVRIVTGLLPYRDEASIQLTGAIFRQTARLARSRGARALFLAPQLGRERPRGDAYLVDELLVRQGLEVVDPDWEYETLPGDNHPNAAATRTMAAAVVDALAREVP
jgi:hypothetical protein